MYRVDVTPVVGLPQFSGWSQVISSNFSSSQLVCAFSVSGDHAGNAGRDFTEKISHAQANSPQELSQFIDDLVSAAAELGVTIQIACGVFTTDKIILGALGGRVFLKRGERTGVLLSSKNQIKIVEGRRKESDVVVLLTNQATDFINEIEQKFLSGFETDSVVTSIIPGLHGLDDSSLSSLAFVVGGKEFVEEEEVPVVAQTEKVEATELDDVSTEILESLQDDLQEEETEPVLDIPPALKLRGAGKSRQVDPFEVPTAQSKAQEGGFFGGLGEAQPAEPINVPAPISKAKDSLTLLLGKLVSRVRAIDWRAILVKVIGLFSWLKEILVKVGKMVVTLFRRVTNKDIYLRASSPRQLVRVVLPIVLGVALIGGLIGFRLYKNKQQLNNANQVLEPIIQQLESIHSRVDSEPILSRESVAESIAQLEQLEKDFTDQKKAQKLVTEQLVIARELYDQISGEEEFGQLEIFYDLRLVDSEFLVSSLDATQSEAVFLDKEKKQLISLNLTNKQVKKFDLSNEKDLVDLELTDSIVTFLGEGVSTKDLKEEDNLSEIIEEGDSNRSATFIEGFATYIYVLNPEKRNIYRYAKQEEGYSDPIGWVSGAAGFDYNQVSSWAIDGELWVATREGVIHKLASGEEQDFKIVGLNEPFSKTLQVFTHEELENVYVLEPDGKRLVILNKEGEFLKEIKSDSLSSTTTLFVSEELKKAFAVSGSIVYSMGI